MYSHEVALRVRVRQMVTTGKTSPQKKSHIHNVHVHVSVCTCKCMSYHALIIGGIFVFFLWKDSTQTINMSINHWLRCCIFSIHITLFITSWTTKNSVDLGWHVFANKHFHIVLFAQRPTNSGSGEKNFFWEEMTKFWDHFLGWIFA